jgi:hypothetical protein
MELVENEMHLKNRELGKVYHLMSGLLSTSCNPVAHTHCNQDHACTYTRLMNMYSYILKLFFLIRVPMIMSGTIFHDLTCQKDTDTYRNEEHPPSASSSAFLRPL